ncbi:DUF262 domain-containing protein [Dactylosporangium sp. CA-052675]|uniref:DUF262 domain-containing protein n=1 Tax=Dactylosporangium sp. CA-052675 TaxID=3239927 RepID=UPI003D91BE0A
MEEKPTMTQAGGMTVGLDTKTGARTYTLDELVRLAWSGNVRVPHFQRGFRWTKSDVLQLVDSIYRGYPIGNLLLWERRANADRLQLGALTIDAAAMGKALWVVDGQQRVTSLANVLHPDARREPRFALGFDLRDQRIVPLDGTDDALIVPLPVLFDLAQVLSWFADRPEAAEGRDAAFAFARDLRQYAIPAYQVEQGDVRVLQDIFDRLNNSGKKLSRAEVFFALNAGNEDDGRLSFQRIAEHIDERFGFGLLPEDTVLQCVLARRGPNIEREIRVEFDPLRRRGEVDFPDEDADAAYAHGEEAIGRAVEFIRDAGVPHYGMLPYRYLLVVLTRFLSLHPDPSPGQLRLLRRWFWRAAVAGPVVAKGSTTGTTRSLTSKIRRSDPNASLNGLLELVGPSALPDARRFRSNDASGKITTCWLWSRHPRNPESGEVYSPQDLTTSLAESTTPAEAVRAVYRSGQLEPEVRLWTANRVLMPTLAEAPPAVVGLLSVRPLAVTEADWAAVMESHGITPEAEQALLAGDSRTFLTIRQELITVELRKFLELWCEWGFENTPSLDDMVIEDLGDDESA